MQIHPGDRIHTELKKKLPGWGILVDLKPEMTVEEFRQGKR